MKKRIAFLTLILIGLVSYQAYSQLEIFPRNLGQCPGVALLHTVTNAVNTVCAYDWVVTNGTIQGGIQNRNTPTHTSNVIEAI